MSGEHPLVVFLRARLDEDETRWRALLEQVRGTRERLQGPEHLGRVIPGWFLWGDVADALERLLAGVAAQRELLDHLDVSFEDYYVGGTAADVAAALGVPYSTHPDYQEGWRAP